MSKNSSLKTSHSQSAATQSVANLLEAFELLTALPEDFMQEERKDTLPQERDYEPLKKLVK